MKKIKKNLEIMLMIAGALAVCMSAFAQDKITLTWEVQTGSLDKTFNIIATAGETFTVDWGNGTTTETGFGFIDFVYHTYSAAGTYNVTIAGNTPDCEFTWFRCDGQNLSNLDVSKATALTDLLCYDNSITALDINQNTELTRLECYDNSLTALDVSQNTKLKTLGCSNNSLTALDVSQNTELEQLSCYNNSITALDVSKNTELTSFSCDNNSLTALDVSQNTELTSFSCSDNSIAVLDLSGQNKLRYLECQNNRLTSLVVHQEAPLNYRADISYNHLMLTDIYPIAVQSAGATTQLLGPQHLPIERRNLFENINFSSQAVIEGTNTDFTVAFNGNFAIPGTHYSINAGVITFLKEGVFIIMMSNTKVNLLCGNIVNLFATVLVLPQEAQVITFRWTGGNAKNFYLNATQNKDFYISWGTGFVEEKTGTGSDVSYSQTYTNSMTYEVAIVGTPDCEFTVFGCDYQNLSELDVSKATALTNLYCYNNSITALDVSQNTKLEWLLCFGNLLTALYVSQNTKLLNLSCSGNSIAALDVRQNTALTNLNCSNNSLTALDVRQNTELRSLYCSNNSITALDVSQNTKLNWLQCEFNSLTALDVSQNTELISLFCYDNRLPLSNLYALSEEQVDISYLGKQVLHPITVKIGVEQFEEESFFGGAYTQYDITPNNGYAIMDGKITFNKLGVYEVKMTNAAIQSDPYFPAEVYVRVTVNETGIGVDELPITNYELRIYPNPTNGELNIGYAICDNAICDIEIYDVYGRMLQTISRKSEIGKSEIKIDVSHLPSGIYFLRVGNRTAKFVKN